jgi:hypothetical protein
MYVAENDLEKLARYWVSGSDLRGAGLGQESSAGVVALPLYPFATSRPAAVKGRVDEARRRDSNGASTTAKERDVAQEQG